MNTTLRALTLTASLAVVATLAGCVEPHRAVTRVDPESRIDVDYRFNDVDARDTWREMTADALRQGWIERAGQASGRKPVVIVGPIKNATQTYLDTQMFTTEIERELINSGRVTFVAMNTQRDDIRAERADQQEWASPQTRKNLRAETGADFIMLGRVMEDSPRTLTGRGGVAYYKINLEIINLETNEKVWIGSKEVKKVWRNVP
jgi:uncharacterized protein (TIGR02722 family)